MDALEPHHRDKFEEFKSITGIENDSDDDKIVQLLTIHDFNLNNAISTYFDSGFDSIGNSSSVNVHDEDDSHLTHRHTEHHPLSLMPRQSEAVNLQHQMFFDSFLPKLPKAPIIPTGWQLEVGIHTSIIEDRLRRERQEEEEEEKLKEDINEATESIHSNESASGRSPLNTIWIILLIIPKTILNVVLSAFRFLFGWGVLKTSHSKIPSSFNYDKFIPNYKFLPKLKEDGDGSLLDSFVFHEDNFNEVHQVTQKEYRWLLVVLVNDSVESNNFLHALIGHPDFGKLFNKDTGLFKETEVFVNNIDKSPEAFQVAQTYRAKRIPYLMLVGNISASPEIMPSMSILYKSNLSSPFVTDDELPVTTNKLLKNLAKLLDRFNPQLVSARFDKQEMDISRQIREEQDNAYLRSLEQDKVKKEIKMQEQHAKKLAEQRTNLRHFYLLRLLQTKYIESNVLDEDSETKCKIALKLPNGKRIVELFNGEISLLEFYMYIELKLYLEQQEVELDAIEELIDQLDLDDDTKHSIQDIKDYYDQYSFKFDIIQPYPKKVIHLEDFEQCIKDIAEFSKGANFLIEFNDDDDDDDNEEEESE
ncbi:UBX domain-containing protein 2 [Candida viswanathii]|uniref:UBX domain-containing protein 2 n=1 Tax=Candida viswanathii TaxID=5486 RepID=A0A367XRJ3_9ASCO|nr:UBX domain-containing protein 2 [Candida viswanathii]